MSHVTTGPWGAPEQVIDHVRAELAPTPWRPVRTATSLHVARSWTGVDERGRPIRVTLAIMGGAGGPDCRVLTYTAGLHR